MVKSISTMQFLPFIEFTSCGLLILLKGFPNKAKQIASKMVLLPAPFSPTINVLALRSNCISVKLFPVLRKFFQRTRLNFIIVPHNPVLQHTEFLVWSSIYLYRLRCRRCRHIVPEASWYLLGSDFHRPGLRLRTQKNLL